MKAKANHFRTLVVLWVVVVAVAVALLGVGIRSAETQTSTASTTAYYKVQDLGTLGGNSFATDINDSGQVVGWSSTSIAGYTVARAFLYDESAIPKMQDLGDLGDDYDTRANGINNSGQVVGYSHASNGEQLEQHAFLYEGTKGMQDLNDLIPANAGGTITSASDINSKGQIAGSYFKPLDFTSGVVSAVCDYQAPVSGFDYAAVLTPATAATPATYEVQNLGTLGGDYSHATDVNDSGEVVGYGQTSTCWENAFLYDSATQKMQDLGALECDCWVASDVNYSGQVVGYGVLNGSHAFLYDSATQQMQDLGDLEGGNKSEAMGINDSGTVVGRSYTGAGSYISGPGRAFLKVSGQPMINLNTLIPADSGWTLYEAAAINNYGQIAATGYKEGVGTHALLLTPASGSPPPADTQAPSAPTITSPPNNTYDSDGSFSITGSAEAGSTVELFEGTTSKGTTKADSSPGTWSIALNGVSEGAHTYVVKATDAAGNTSPVSNSVTVTVDKTAPTGTVSINDGASRTRTRSVTLTLSATDPSPGSGVNEMRISNTQSGLASAIWEAYSTSKPWALTAGTGTKTVYVEYRDGVGNRSAVVTDTIRYSP